MPVDDPYLALQGAAALRPRFARPSDLCELTRYPPFATLRPAAH